VPESRLAQLEAVLSEIFHQGSEGVGVRHHAGRKGSGGIGSSVEGSFAGAGLLMVLAVVLMLLLLLCC